MTTPDPQQLDLERLLFRYSMALERGDFDTVTAILQIAAHNADLNRMIQELDAEYALDSHTDLSLSGDPDMAQLTRPLTLPPEKRKLGQPTRRTALLFPFAAAIAVGLVGLSVLAFNRPSNDNAAQFGVNLGSETATPTPAGAASMIGQLPYLVPPAWVNQNGNPTLLPTMTFTPIGPTEIPTQGGLFITFTPTPAGPTLVPTEVGPSFTATPIPMNPAELPTIVPPGVGPIPSLPAPDFSVLATMIPPECGGATSDEADTRVFAFPFPDKTQDMPIGLYAPKSPVIITDMRFDLASAEMWFYVNEQGWVNAMDVVLLPECIAGIEAVEAFARTTNMMNRVQSLNPTNLAPTVPPLFDITATTTPVLVGATPTATFIP